MKRHKAVLINTQTGKAICSAWTPLIHAEELDYANARLRQTRMPYVWQWTSDPSSLTGSVVLSAPADDASTQLIPSSDRS